MKHRLVNSVLCGCAALFILSGCGVKPAFVSPKDGQAASQFPRTYPDTATDPQDRTIMDTDTPTTNG